MKYYQRPTEKFYILCKLIFYALFCIGNTDYIMTAVDFLNIAVELAQAALPLLKVMLRVLHNESHKENTQNSRYNRCYRHNPVCPEHHDQTADKLGGGGNNRCRTVGQALPDGIHIIGDTGQHVTVGIGRKVFERQAVDLSINISTHPVGQLLLCKIMILALFLLAASGAGTFDADPVLDCSADAITVQINSKPEVCHLLEEFDGGCVFLWILLDVSEIILKAVPAEVMLLSFPEYRSQRLFNDVIVQKHTGEIGNLTLY